MTTNNPKKNVFKKLTLSKLIATFKHLILILFSYLKFNRRSIDATNALNATYFDKNYGYFFCQTNYRYYFQKSEYARLNSFNIAWKWRNLSLMRELGLFSKQNHVPYYGSNKNNPTEFYDDYHTLNSNGPIMPTTDVGITLDKHIINSLKKELYKSEVNDKLDLDFYKYEPKKYSVPQDVIDTFYLVDRSDRNLLAAINSMNLNPKIIGFFGVRSPVIETILYTLFPNSKIKYLGPLNNKYNINRIGKSSLDNSEKFNLIILDSSISSFGMGRYGEKIDYKNGDVKLFNKLLKKLEKKGIIITVLPVCDDYYINGVGRIYGQKRIKLLFGNRKIKMNADLSSRDFFDQLFQMKETVFAISNSE